MAFVLNRGTARRKKIANRRAVLRDSLSFAERYAAECCNTHRA
jgi:hypothetical protein